MDKQEIKTDDLVLIWNYDIPLKSVVVVNTTERAVSYLEEVVGYFNTYSKEVWIPKSKVEKVTSH